MKFKVLYNPEIYNDINSAIEWYNQQQNGLGIKFFITVKKQLNSLKTSALHYSVRYDNIRCMPLKKFPYMVHYRVDIKENKVKVEAIFSTYQNPDIWEKRTK